MEAVALRPSYLLHITVTPAFSASVVSVGIRIRSSICLISVILVHLWVSCIPFVVYFGSFFLEFIIN
jgi:hypothetical protein